MTSTPGSSSTAFIRAVGAGNVLTAEATPIHRGRTQQLWQVEIVGPDDRLVSRGAVRLANLETRGDHPGNESRSS
jgi:acyl-coenzyme A thioesterase PaaI-like protein